LVELCGCLAVPRALSEYVGPKLSGTIGVAALSGQHRQVAPGEMPVDSMVDAAKLFGPVQGEDPPPARLGLARLAPVPVNDRFAKPELGILRFDRESWENGDALLNNRPIKQLQ
jgi:hypothetical protein